MMLYNMKKYFFLSIVLILLGCSSNLGTLSLVSTLQDEINEEYESIGMISGKDTQYMIMGMPTGFPRIDNAVNDALIKNNAIYLTNTKVKYNRAFFLMYFGFMEYTVTGEGWVEVGQTRNQKQDAFIPYDNKNQNEKKRNIIVIDKEVKKPTKNNSKEVRYDPQTGLPIKATKYDPETGEPIYEE